MTYRFFVSPWIAATILVATSNQVFGEFGFDFPSVLNSAWETDDGGDGEVRLAADDTGHLIAVWQIGSSSSGNDVLFSVSTDFGAAWSASETLNDAGDAATDDDFAPVVETNGTGTWISVWGSTNTLGNTIGTDFDIVFSRSVNNGETWSAPASLNPLADNDSQIEIQNDQFPQIACDKNGNWLAVWESTTQTGPNAGEQIIYSSLSGDDGLTWSVPVEVYRFGPPSTTSGNLRLVNSEIDEWVVAWVGTDNLDDSSDFEGDILFSRSEDNGATWSAANAINHYATVDGTDLDYAMDLASDGSGRCIAVWNSGHRLGGLIAAGATPCFYSVSTDSGSSWSNAKPIDPGQVGGGDVSFRPSIATTGQGDWLVAYHSRKFNDPSGGVDIGLTRSTDGGSTWSETALLNGAYATVGSDNNQHFIAISASPGGQWAIAWSTSLLPGGSISTDAEILVSVSQGLDPVLSTANQWSLYH